MQEASYTTTITVQKPVQEVMTAIQDFRGWWSQEISGPTDMPGESFLYHYKDVHRCRLVLLERVEGKKLVYQVLDNLFSFTQDKTEWINTRLVFDLQAEGDRTTIVFTHEGLVPSYECYAVCNDAWTSYIQGSLKDFIETGTGRPNAKEGGLNAELVEKWGLPDK